MVSLSNRKESYASDKPHLFFVGGKWYCANNVTITPGQTYIYNSENLGKGASPKAAYLDWSLRVYLCS